MTVVYARTEKMHAKPVRYPSIYPCERDFAHI